MDNNRIIKAYEKEREVHLKQIENLKYRCLDNLQSQTFSTYEVLETNLLNEYND